MKNKFLFPFISACIILIFTYLIFAYLVNDNFNKSKVRSELEIVNANDIIKNAQKYLEEKKNDNLTAILKKSGFNLIIYDTKGTLIFDSSHKESTAVKVNIGKVLSEIDSTDKVSVINYFEGVNNKTALVLISPIQKNPEADYLKEKTEILLGTSFLVFVILILLIFIFIYLNVLSPFRKLEHFTGEVARGNLDIPLIHSRRNFFGAFTWAFDMLRNELKTSREREAEAERTKKELVAALSHDVRTPIASIRAYTECLKSLPDKNTARGEKYIDVILEKTDEISKLSQDMFMQAISDLGKLEINTEEYRSRELLNSIMEPLILQFENRMVITSPFPDVEIYTDRMRLEQVFENVISNTVKYSPGSDIHISSYLDEGMFVCRIKDFGEGVFAEDIPFLFDKFFRGKNAKESGQPGSGLGLYISGYILEKTGGKIKAFNYSENGASGFVVEISIRLV